MTLKDFFHLSEAEFAERISKLSDEELMQEDISNCRTIHGGAYGAIMGAAQAPLTMGISLAGSAVGLRRRNVAQRRLAMIHQEVVKRGLPIHEETKRDYLIPLGITGVTFGISAGVAAGVERLVEPAVEAGIVFSTSAATNLAQEAAGRMGVEMGSEKVIDRRVPKTGRSAVWSEKLRLSRESSFDTNSLALPESFDVGPESRSAPTSPLLLPEKYRVVPRRRLLTTPIIVEPSGNTENMTPEQSVMIHVTDEKDIGGLPDRPRSAMA